MRQRSIVKSKISCTRFEPSGLRIVLSGLHGQLCKAKIPQLNRRVTPAANIEEYAQNGNARVSEYTRVELDKHLQGAHVENLLGAGTSEGDVKSTYPAQQIDGIPEALKTDGLLTGDKAIAELLDDKEGESDYLVYAQDRAMFF
jgi:hypothetical protein